MDDTATRTATEVARRFFTAYDQHDVPGMLALCAADATYDYVPYGERGQGRVHDTAATLWAGFVDALPDFSVQVHRVLACGQRTVVVEATQGGTQVKDIAGITSRNRATHVPHCFLLDLDDDSRIAHITAYWDNDSIFAQLGHTETHD